jgi:hypothetical protein
MLGDIMIPLPMPREKQNLVPHIFFGAFIQLGDVALELLPLRGLGASGQDPEVLIYLRPALGKL